MLYKMSTALINISKSKSYINVPLDVFLLEEDGMIVSYCPSLQLSSYGEDIQDAKKAFKEAMDIFLQDTIHKGTLEKVLLKLGWTLKAVPKPAFEPPSIHATDIKRMSKHIIQNMQTKISIPAYS